MAPFSFPDLPLELRQRIIAAAFEEPRVAHLACISREWQAEVEARTFRSLLVRRREMDDFDSLVTGKREHLVSKICLSIDFDVYLCSECRTIGDGDVHFRNSSTVGRTLQTFLLILRRWTPGRVTLEINMYSPSDKQHFFKGYYVGDPTEDDASGAPPAFVDGLHGWYDQERDLPFPDAIHRVHCPMFGARPGFVPTKAVQTLLIRRQCRRLFDPQLFCRLVHALRGLEHMHLEPWRPFDWGRWLAGCRKSYSTIIAHHLPPRLKTLMVFEDFNPGFNLQTLGHPITSPSRSLTAAIATASVLLEQLSASFLVDAKLFFEACTHLRPGWENMKFLALTSTLLDPDISGDGWESRLVDLLREAAQFAIVAPKLRFMFLWYGRRGKANAFIYNREDASITWHGTDAFNLDRPRITQMWQRVLDRLGVLHGLDLKTTRVMGQIRSHGDAIHYLGLSGVVIDAQSLRQIRLENNVPISDGTRLMDHRLRRALYLL